MPDLGKDVTITGLDNVRSYTFTETANEVDCTSIGDTARKYRKTLVDVTVEAECVDSPGVSVGDEFTFAGHTGTATFVCTSISKECPIDGIETTTVSGAFTVASSGGGS